MSAEIKNLSPQPVWGYFYDLTQIPRPTGHMEAVTRFMISFGKGLGLETLQDEVGNVLIRKPATPGMEGRKTVTLQSHLDMVPQKNSSVKHDFEKDPIDAYIDGDWVPLWRWPCWRTIACVTDLSRPCLRLMRSRVWTALSA